MPDRGQTSRYLALTISWAAAIWVAALLLAALPAASRAHAILAGAARAAGSLVCHQRPERSFHMDGRQFPVCARCAGLYLAGMAGALVGWVGRARVPRRTRRLLALAAAPTAATLLLEWLGVRGVSNMERALASLPLGAAAGWLFVRMLRAESRASTCAMIA